MTSAPPVLSPLALPAPQEARRWLVQRCDDSLARAAQTVAELKSAQDPSAAQVVDAWNEIQIALGNASAAASVHSETHPDAAVREAGDDAMRRIDAFSTDLGLDRELSDIVGAVSDEGLDHDSARLLSRIRRDFHRSGVDRDEATRARLKELAELELAASQEFSRNIRDGVRTIRVRPEDLAGLPEDWLKDHPADDNGLVTVTTDYPDSVPLMSFCTNRATREAMTLERLNVAWPVNDEVLLRLIALRQERATLLGYATWADFDAEVKMIKTGTAIREFIDKIAAAAQDSALRDKGVVLRRMQQDVPEAQDITSVDLAYYGELVRKETYDVDAQLVRTYFDFAAVRQGLLDVTARLFGLSWVAVLDAPVWHPDVTAYDVVRDDERIGRIYLDLHPRDGKFKHAAQFDLVSGVTGRQLPEGVLVCNLTRGLMEHDEVVTLFHEFGHLIHHVVGGNQRYVRFSGVATEWDFVEAPSQMLEEWAWDPTVLASFAKNDAGQPIPAALVERMKKGEDFGKGYQARTQMFYAGLSHALYTDPQTDVTATLREQQQRYSVFPYIPGTHFHCAFGHLDGYSSGYYTYMWSLVIAKDMFSAFDPHDLFDEHVASRYRDTVLAPGGSHDAADLVADFLGRPYSFDAYAEWLAR
ncbi:M3 family metallopeptidase [Branchiibius hedensis]|uniref:M3 family metallopeptidase n=1 Tax=Branchiibius hedensis TaxID=672460 RepID=UPI001FE6F516|nr:M3 family metallopeptidase [Branchiibius hedensis]